MTARWRATGSGVLEAALGQHPHVGDIRGRGLFRALEFVRRPRHQAPFDRRTAQWPGEGGVRSPTGIAVLPVAGTVDGVAGDHVILAPPYNVTAAQVDDIVERTAAMVADAMTGIA